MSLWIPEDDLLLKNAVEAGASLEALAKGAVRFSRRFSVQELQDRWHSLLYDPDISVGASARMFEYELSAPKSTFGNTKESEEGTRKRKTRSVRAQYYAMRKRIHSETFNSTYPSFLDVPNVHDCVSGIGGCPKCLPFDNEPPFGSCMLGDRISDHYGLQETGSDFLNHVLPQVRDNAVVVKSVSGTANAIYTEEDIHPNEILKKDSLFEFPEDVCSLPLKEPLRNDSRNDGRHSFDQESESKEVPHIIEDNLEKFENCSAVEETEPSQELLHRNIFKTNHSGPKPSTPFESINTNLENVCCGFGGRERFNSPVSDGMPLWKTIEDVSAPAMPMNVSLRDKALNAEGTLTQCDGRNLSLAGDNIVHLGSMLEDRHSNDGLNSSAAVVEGDFGDLPDSLLNFENEDELLFIDVVGKDMNKPSCENVDSVLLCSPTDMHEGDVPGVGEHKASTVLNKLNAIPDDGCPAELDCIADPSHPNNCIPDHVHESEVNESSSTSVPKSHSPEIHDGFVYCTLNTHDPVIPCNDDIFLPVQVPTFFASYAMQPVSTEASDPTYTSNKKDIEHGSGLMNRGENPAQCLRGSPIGGSQTLPGGLGHSCFVSEGKYELSGHACLTAASIGTEKIQGYPSQYRLSGATPNSTTCRGIEEMTTPTTFKEYSLLHAEPASNNMAFLDPEVNQLTSDQEEYESDDDIPYFSDVEAMILEMDLGPYDQESYISKEVSRYQNEDAKRTIMRLEQCAHSALQRAIGPQSAFAILYGRHVKHYIKKVEVMLGRATDDTDVDIDLGRERCANKISRRQAIIKLETDGSFSLKNLGKSSILVNGKEVATGQLLSLSSSCLIEIRGLNFVFEMNYKSVRRYLAKISRGGQERNANFEWVHEGGP